MNLREIFQKKLYKIAEKIRFEKIGSEKFKGVANNLNSYYQERINSLDLKSSEDKIVESFENYFRVKFFNFKNNKDLDKSLRSFNKDLNEKFKEKIQELDSLSNNQAKYNSLISSLISNMKLDENTEKEDLKDDQNKEEKQKTLKIKIKKLTNKSKIYNKCP